jgi:FkbM family methyltransferase
MFRHLGLDLSRYDPATDKWLAQKRLLDDTNAPVILDLGANTGQTLESYLALFPDGEIHCFEPYPETYLKLLELSSRHDKVKTYQLAIADRVGERQLYVNTVYHVTNSLLPRPASGHRYYPEGAELKDSISVMTETLDGFASRASLRQIDILKMDIQGGELAALRGAERLLKVQGVRLIMTEVMFVPHYEGGAMFHELYAHLANYGYSLFGIYDIHFADNGQLRFADAIFINRELRDDMVRRNQSSQGT